MSQLDTFLKTVTAHMQILAAKSIRAALSIVVILVTRGPDLILPAGVPAVRPVVSVITAVRPVLPTDAVMSGASVAVTTGSSVSISTSRPGQEDGICTEKFI